MSQALIVAAEKIIDGVGSLQPVHTLIQQLSAAGITPAELVIEPLSADWHTPLKPGHFRSGCGPLEALQQAREMIADGRDAVLIRGEDHIKTGYERQERLERMAIYGAAYPLTEAYDELAQQFIRHHDTTPELFRQIATALFDNYHSTYRNVLADRQESTLPSARWFEPLTSLFRGVDCANPMVDFSGAMLIVSAACADRLQIDAQQRVSIKGIGIHIQAQDGRDAIDEIVPYNHLQDAYHRCCEEAGIDFAAHFCSGRALLETYTCYPVVPMAFLLSSGLVSHLDEIPAFLERHQITITGGMNLARAPWNNPALSGLISMYQALIAGRSRLGAVHGNGGLGYRQGFAMLEAQG